MKPLAQRRPTPAEGAAKPAPVEALKPAAARPAKPAPERSGAGAFPAVRMRRNRRTRWSRRLVAEHVLTPADLIWPIFVVDGRGVREPVASMPGVERLSVDLAVAAAEEAAALGIPAIALFPYTDPKLRTEDGREAFNRDNLVCRATRAIRKAGLDVGVLLDVALDPYTSHGHDGLMRDGEIVNDETLEALVRQSLVQAEAGCDIIAPSDMMDGRVGAIRKALEAAGYRQRADHGVRGQVRLGVLRPVPRCGRLVDDARSATSAPTRWTRPTPTRRCARWRSTSPRAPTW